jgi:hypothetical protein
VRRGADPAAVQASPFPSPSAQAEGQVAEHRARHRTTPDTRPFAGAKGDDRARAPPPPDATAHRRASAARDAHRRPVAAHLGRGRLLDLAVAGKSPDVFRRAVLGGRRGHAVMEHLGRRREREERSLDRAHRRFLRRRLGRRTGLVESAGEPEDLPSAANRNRGEAEATAAARKVVGEPERAAAVALSAPKMRGEPEVPLVPAALTESVAGKVEVAPLSTALTPKVVGEPEIAPPPAAAAQEFVSEPERAPRPALPAPADPADARALYAEILLHPRRETIEARIRPLPRRPKERLLEGIRCHGCIDKQPRQMFRAWQALVRSW